MESNKVQNYKSCFDIIGPIMVGPSSSHTAGAIAIGALARQLFGGTPNNVRCDYYESFAETHKGHGTDFAIISGILGFATDDERVPRAVEIARDKGVKIEFVERKEMSPVNHANTADLTLSDEKRKIRLIGTSVGGGAVEVKYIEVDSFKMELSGPLPLLLEVVSLGEMPKVYQLLQEHGVTISKQRVAMAENRQMIGYELADLLSPELKQQIQTLRQTHTIYLFA